MNSPCCRLQLLPHPTMPCRTSPRQAATRRAPPRHDHSPKEQQGERRPSVLLSAAIAGKSPTLPKRTMTRQALPNLLSKESSRGERTPQCCRLQLLPRRAKPCHAHLSRASPCQSLSTLRKEQQRELAPSVLPSAAIALPRRSAPSLNRSNLAGPCWGLHQRMPSMIRPLQPAYG